MNIAIISFQDNTDVIGAKYIHAYLNSQNQNSYLILQPHSNPASDTSIFTFISDNNIEMVGISLMSCEYMRACKFATEFKSRFSNIPIVFGGIHATVAPEECLLVGDIVVRGEGEHTILELVHCLENKLDYSELEGICFNLDGKIKVNPPRALERDIDIFPTSKHLPDKMYVVHNNIVLKMGKKLFALYSRFNGRFPSIKTTRGCTFSCTYCGNSAFKELYNHYPVRKRSVKSVIDEIVELISEHKDSVAINMQDDCFLSHNSEWIQEFAKQYKSKVNIPFKILTTPNHITIEKLTLLKDAGLMLIMMGLQSGSERVNREVYKRSISNETFLKATILIRNLKIAAIYDIILDNPYETEEDLLKTLDIILKIPKPFQLQLFSLCFYQGTELYKRAINDKLLFDNPKTHEFKLSASILNKLIYLTPTFPVSLIKYFIKNRSKRLVMLFITIAMLLNTFVLFPLSLLRIMHFGKGFNFYATLKIIMPLKNTASRKIFKNKLFS